MTRATALVLLIAGAAALRITYDTTFAPEAVAEPLSVPFSRFPLDVLGPGWRGENVELEDAVVERSGVSDYLNQSYTNGRRTVRVYVGYVSGYSPGSIHYPEVCFPSSGFQLESKSIQQVPVDGLDEGAAMNEYVWSRQLGGGTYTLSTFCYNGKFEPREWRLRADRVVGIRYFAIITISGDLLGDLETTRAAYKEVVQRMIPRLQRHLPSNE